MFYDIHSKGAESYIQLAQRGLSRMPRNALGRGLGALIRESEPTSLPAAAAGAAGGGLPSGTPTAAAVAPALSEGFLHVAIDINRSKPLPASDALPGRSPRRALIARSNRVASCNRSWCAIVATATSSSPVNVAGEPLNAPTPQCPVVLRDVPKHSRSK